MDDTLVRTALPALSLLALAAIALALGVLGILARRRLDRARAGTSVLAQAAEGDLVVEVQICAHDLVGAGQTILAVMAQHASGVGAQIAAVAQTTATVEEVKVSAQHAASRTYMGQGGSNWRTSSVPARKTRRCPRAASFQSWTRLACCSAR